MKQSWMSITGSGLNEAWDWVGFQDTDEFGQCAMSDSCAWTQPVKYPGKWCPTSSTIQIYSV